MIIKKRNGFAFTALGFSTILAFCATDASAQTQVFSAGTSAAVANRTVLIAGDVATGVLPHTQPMHVAVALKLRNVDQLNAAIAAHQVLTSEQFTASYAPTLLQARAVATYLTQTGFNNVVIAPNRLLVTADGTAGNAQAAFLTSFSKVQTHSGRTAFANNSDAHVPTSLQPSVLSVIGLQNVHLAHTNGMRLQTNAASSSGPITHDPVEFSSIYGGAGLASAASVTVGIVTVGDMTQPPIDLASFTSTNKLTSVPTQTIYTGSNSGDTSETSEWDMDGQAIVGSAGGQVGKIIYYATPTFSYADLVADFNTVVTDNVAKIINVSIGGCETSAKNDGATTAGDQILMQGMSQGQTFSVSTGDSGADECGDGGVTPEWPASSPYVVAAGGTHLEATTTTWNGEVVWNNLPYRGAGGGSPSTFEPKPSWQNAVVPGTTRGTPDISFDADPFTGANIIVNGEYELWGGTSLAAPIFAGQWARVLAIKGVSVGFAAPWLYQIPASDFHDVVSGNNGGETAAVGYDSASGLGSMIIGTAIQHISTSNPITANFSASSSGVIAKFTDSSTDSSGAIAAHAWTFGDGGKATTASPSHAYSKAGIYSVAETVSDQNGWSATKTVSVTIK